MKRDSGMKNRDERSRGMEICMTDTFAKSNQQNHLDFPNQHREEIETDPIGFFLL